MILNHLANQILGTKNIADVSTCDTADDRKAVPKIGPIIFLHLGGRLQLPATKHGYQNVRLWQCCDKGHRLKYLTKLLSDAHDDSLSDVYRNHVSHVSKTLMPKYYRH